MTKPRFPGLRGSGPAVAAATFLALAGSAFAASPAADHAHGRADAPAVHAAEDAPRAHDDGAHRLTLDDGRKWETDAPLRQGMSRIRAEVEARLERARAGTMDEAQYEALARRVDAQIAYMVENCRLAPEPDNVLHVILSHAAEGSEALKGGVQASRRQGFDKVIESLHLYGEYFEHPQWEAPGTL